MAVMMALLPTLILTLLGLLLSASAREVAAANAGASFGPGRLARQLGLSVFLITPAVLWTWRGGGQCSWWKCSRQALAPALGFGLLIGLPTLLLRARPFGLDRLLRQDTWWALGTYATVALSEEALFRGLVQGRLERWLGRWPGLLLTAVFFTLLHLPAQLLGGEPLWEALRYAGTQLMPMALLFGASMIPRDHVLTPVAVHLFWNWASVLRGV
jgi:membrane protease YdiL (CAAX protease family)